MAKDMTLVWASGSPPCWRVMICLEEKNLQGYNQKLISMEKKEHKAKEVLDLNPRGQVPTFNDGNIIVNDSYASCLYLANRYKSQGTQLIPDSADELAFMYQRMMEGVVLMDKMRDIVLYKFFTPENEKHESAMKRKMEALAEEVKLWEKYMGQTPGGFIAGKTFTLADVLIFPVVAFIIRNGLSEERYPKLAAYVKSLTERPSVKATWPPHWKTSPGLGLVTEI
ncbi:uncharacterized protein V6R79_017294 [Siganus canaliculatus]